MPEGERAAEHDREVGDQRQRDAGDVPRSGGDGVALQREQDDDREQQPVQGDRPDAGQEPVLVPVPAAGAFSVGSGEEAGEQRDAEEHEHRDQDGGDGEVGFGLREAEPAGQQVQVEPAQRRERDDLEHRVERDEDGGGLPVTAGQLVPDQHHRDAAGQPDDDQPGAVGGQVGQHQPGQGEHQRRAENPVQHQRAEQQPTIAGDPVELGVADLGQHRVHHQQQADRDRQADRADLDLVQVVGQ